MMDFSVTSAPGTYALVLALKRTHSIQVGRLGRFRFKPGKYLYVGSALGPGGLAARIAHHCSSAIKPRWHIDYLRAVADPGRVWYIQDAQRREHQWARIIAGMQSVPDQVPGFGASDCRCPSHLFRFEKLPPLKDFKRRIHDSIPGHGRIKVQWF